MLRSVVLIAGLGRRGRRRDLAGTARTRRRRARDRRRSRSASPRPPRTRCRRSRQPHSGALPTAGPASAGGPGGFGGGRGGGVPRRCAPAPARRARPAASPAAASPNGGFATGPGGAPTGGSATAAPRRSHAAADRRRRRRTAQRLDAERGDHRAVRAEHGLPLDRGGDRREQRGRVPARLRQGGHGDRRLQRHRPDARRSPSSSSTCAPATIHYFIAGGGGGGGGAGAGARSGHVERDHPVGRAATSPPRPSAAPRSTT